MMATQSNLSETVKPNVIKSLPWSCRLGFHHWHYNTFIVDGWFYADPHCWRCHKEGKLITCSSIKQWFAFGNNWADLLLHQLKHQDSGNDLVVSNSDTTTEPLKSAQSNVKSNGRKV